MVCETFVKDFQDSIIIIIKIRIVKIIKMSKNALSLSSPWEERGRGGFHQYYTCFWRVLCPSNIWLIKMFLKITYSRIFFFFAVNIIVVKNKVEAAERCLGGDFLLNYLFVVKTSYSISCSPTTWPFWGRRWWDNAPFLKYSPKQSEIYQKAPVDFWPCNSWTTKWYWQNTSMNK